MSGEIAVPMTRSERADFEKYTRQYVRAIKARGEAHAAQLALACEEELSRVYEANDARWAAAVAKAEAEVAKANRAIKAAFAHEGLTNTQRMPELAPIWLGRGETWDKDRRAELRKVADAQAKLLVKAAAAKAEEIATEYQTRVLLDDLSREQAIELARGLPNVQELMPPLDPVEVHKIARQENKGYRSWWPELLPDQEKQLAIGSGGGDE
jgi:hypothetical protein